MDTNTQIERLIELAIVQRTELKRLVEELPQLKEHLSAEIERTFEETEPQLRAELEEWTSKQAADKTAALGVALESKIASLAKTLEETAQAKFSAILAARDQNADLLKQAEERIAVAASEISGKVKEIVTAELARFPRAGEIDQLRKEFQEPRGLNPRGKWLPDQTYNKLDLVTWNGDSYVSNTDGNKERPGRNAANWTLSAARGTSGGGPADLSALTAVPSNGELLIGSGTSWVNGQLTAGAGVSITVGPGAITISATDGDITLDDGTAASPSLHFTNDPDTGIYRPAANTLGISVSGTQVAYFDENGLTVPSAGVVAGGSFHGANGNANNPSYSFSGDQDTGFFRHQPNEIGIALGGTQYATLTSTTFSITPVVTMASSLRVNGTTDSSSKDTGAIITEGGLGVEKSATIGGNLTVSGLATVSTTGNDKQLGSFYSTDLSNGSAVDLVLGKAFSANNSAFIRYRKEATTSTLSFFHYGDSGDTFKISKGEGVSMTGNLTVNGTGTSTFSGSITSTGSGDRDVKAVSTAGEARVTLDYYGTGGYGSFQIFRDGTRKWRIGVFNNADANPPLQFYQEGVGEAGRFAPTSGNFLIGGVIDGGQKLQVSGTGLFTGDLTVSSGGLTVSKTSNDALLTVSTTGAGAFVHVDSNNDGYMGIRFKAAGVDKWTIGAVNGNGVFTIARSGGATNRYFELSTTGDATFAGNGKIGADYTVAQKKLEIIGGSYADGQTLRLADYSTAYGFDIVNDGVNAKLKVIRHSNSVGGTEAMAVSRDAALTTFEGAIAVADGMTAPSATSGVAKIYVDTADGDLKVIFGDGTVKTIVTD